MPVILDETLADFDLLAFEVYVQVNLKFQHTGGVEGGGGVRGASLLCFQEVSQWITLSREL